MESVVTVGVYADFSPHGLVLWLFRAETSDTDIGEAIVECRYDVFHRRSRPADPDVWRRGPIEIRRHWRAHTLGQS